MKIGIVTTYDELNFGAYLQAYSLSKFIESLGHNVELVNYKSLEYKIAELKATYKIKNPIYLLKVFYKSIKFNRVLSLLNISKNFNNIKEINDYSYDLLIFGSDEIWNLNNALGGIIDTYFFGDGLAGKKISYAASFGSTDIYDGKISSIKNMLLDFSSISVRDQNSKDIVSKISNMPVDIVLDPTFLIDHNVPKPNLEDKYIFYYYLGNNKNLEDEMITFAKEKSLDIISFGYKSKRFKNIISIDPFEWLSYLKYSDFVVTNMFHGTVFSILFGKKFMVDITDYRKNKLEFLINMFELKYRKYCEGCFQNIDSDINYEHVFNILKVHRATSINFLMEALK